MESHGTGDDDLRQLARDLLGDRHDRVALAVCSPERDAGIGWGLDPQADIEIGSVSKSLTGLLFANSLDRGETTRLTPLGDLLPTLRGPAAGITLGALAAHRSGLGRVPAAARPLRRGLASARRGTNPYGDSLEELLQQVALEKVGSARRRYSNTGYQLLGHAVAAAASMDFASLLSARLTEPLGLVGTFAPTTQGGLRPRSARGRSRRGRDHEAWVGEALAPAGGIRMTQQDLLALLRALLDGTAPGLAALEAESTGRGPLAYGMGWIQLSGRDGVVTWHNGRTGGFASFIGLDRAAGSGVAVVSATAASVDRLGFQLLSASRGGAPG